MQGDNLLVPFEDLPLSWKEKDGVLVSVIRREIDKVTDDEEQDIKKL